MSIDSGASHEPLVEITSIVTFFWANKLLLVATALLGAIAAYAISLAFDPWYRATTVIMPAPSLEAGGGLGGLAGLEDIASLAGLGSGDSAKEKEAIATLKSRSLARQFISEHSLIESFDPRSDEEPLAKTSQAALTRAERYFNEHVLHISEDRKSGLFRVSIEYPQGEDASNWANAYVQLANKNLRQHAIEEAEGSIAFLREEAAKTEIIDLRQVLFALVQQHVQTIALARVRPDYAFVTIDAAIEPDADDIVRPRRVVIAALGFILGGLLGLFVALFRAQRGGNSSNAAA